MKIYGIIFTLIFGLIFAGAGSFFLYETSISTFQSWMEMKNWLPADAKVIKVSSHSDATKANYTYAINNTKYQNDRLYVASFSDNIGSYQDDMYDRLYDAKHSNEPITIWYNAADPNQAVFDRDMRWGLFILVSIFCSIFIVIGVTVAYAGIFGKTKSKKPKASLAELRKEWQHKQTDSNYKDNFFAFLRQKSHDFKKQALPVSDSPWLAKKEWQTPFIRSGAKTMIYFMWGFAVFWNAVSFPAAFSALDEIDGENYLALLAFLFPLVGVILIIKAIKLSMEWLRFGVLEVELDPFPGSIGGHVGGQLVIKNLTELQAEYKVKLECVYTYISGSGDNRSRRESTKWAQQGHAKVEPLGRGLRLSFRFDVPEDLPQADIEQTDAYHFWRLSFSADIPGADLNRQYNIPVFNTKQSSRNNHHDLSAQVQATREKKAKQSQSAIERGELHNTDLDSAFKYTVSGDTTCFYHPMFRNKALTIFALVFAGGFGAAVFGITSGFDGGLAIFSLLFSIPFVLVALVASIAAIYLPFNNLSTCISQGKLNVKRRIFIFPVATHQLSNNEIKSLSIKKNGSTGSGVHMIEHYKVMANTITHKQITLAEGINGEDLANQLKSLIEQKLKY